MLIARGADVNSKTGSGRTPLHVAAERGNADAVRVLVNRDADFSARDRSRRTALDAALKCKSTDAGDLLLAKGASPSSSKLQSSAPSSPNVFPVRRRAMELSFPAIPFQLSSD